MVPTLPQVTDFAQSDMPTKVYIVRQCHIKVAQPADADGVSGWQLNENDEPGV